MDSKDNNKKPEDLPQIIVVDDAELARTCNEVVNGYDWLSTSAAMQKMHGRRCVVVGRAGDASKLTAEATAKLAQQRGATEIKIVLPEANRAPGWGLDHAFSEGWDRSAVLAWLRANARKYEPAGGARPNLQTIYASRGARAEARRASDPNFDRWKEWGLQLGANGGPPLANLNNAVAILENDEELKGIVWFDDFLQRVMTEDPPREWADADDIRLALHMQRNLGMAKIGREIVAQAVLAVAHNNRQNCVRDWLDSLVHDGTPRIDEFFADCFGAESNEYTRAASRNFWISMVARVYHPGCKVDNMVVLEGKQGLGKSTALQVIGGDWFAEQHESATNPKGFAEILQGKLLIEISEMDSFNRAEVNRVKQTISCPSDRYRASYGRYANDHPRQCIFVGTTNRDDWNRDETGARRFWPISCRGQVNLSAVRNNRDQLFAEAVKRHKASEPHWNMPMESTQEEQRARFSADPWQQAVEDIIKGEASVTTAHIAQKLGIPIERRDRTMEMRIGGCLRFMGWKRRQARVEGKPSWVYEPPE